MNDQQLQFNKMIHGELFLNEFPEIIKIKTNYGEQEWENEHDVYFEIFVPKSWWDVHIDNGNRVGGISATIALYRRRISKRLTELSKYVGITLPRFYPTITYVDNV